MHEMVERELIGLTRISVSSQSECVDCGSDMSRTAFSVCDIFQPFRR
jgi:hypothetical protein